MSLTLLKVNGMRQELASLLSWKDWLLWRAHLKI